MQLVTVPMFNNLLSDEISLCYKINREVFIFKVN